MKVVGQIQQREVGHRKSRLLGHIYNQLNRMARKGMSPAAVGKFLKINIRTLTTTYTTKQLTGVLGQLKEFEAA